jgi:glycosyltransferase involved in cell wall biosynthesis
VSRKIRIVIDAKNLALYSGGISNWFAPLLHSWISSSTSSNRYEFFIVAPIGQDLKLVEAPGLGDVQVINPRWPTFLKRQLRHVAYDNWIFPRLIRRIKPQCVVSPYHDILLPKTTANILSVMTVHDLCFMEVPRAYPWAIRTYYLWMLKRNLRRAHHLLTVSETTRQQLVNIFKISEKRITVIPNLLDPEFSDAVVTGESIYDWKIRHLLPGYKGVLYASGVGHRKNIENMLSAFRLLWSQSHRIQLWITGQIDARWTHLFFEEELASKKIVFLGFLTLSNLRLAYEAADAVIYPSLCEGFGRSCLEAMVCGAPLACSDIAVFHEVAGDYPQYFDPLKIDSIAKALSLSLEQSRPKPNSQSRYGAAVVQEDFVETMNRVMLEGITAANGEN